MRNFRELQVWQNAMEIASMTYMVTKSFPAEEKFGLVSQLNRAAVSISSNIAEGASRGSDKDFKRFLEIAIGSAFEAESQLLLAENIGFVTKDQVVELLNILNEEQRMLSVFIKKLTPNTYNPTPCY